MGLWRLFNFDTIGTVIIIILVLYFFFTTKRKKYKFLGLKDINPEDIKRKKKKKRQRGPRGIFERRCREIFESIYHTRFRSTRPKFLKNPTTGKNLELDGYNANVPTPLGRGLAFEYDGQQHSRYTPYFHSKGPKEFEYQYNKDRFKDAKCKQLGILLIRIPHFVPHQDLERYIRRALQKAGALPQQVIAQGVAANFMAPGLGPRGHA